MRSSFSLPFLVLMLFIALISNFPITKAENDVEVGVYYYAWYPCHWNGTPPEPLPRTWWTVVDKPILGWYNSSDTDLIKAHLGMMHQIGITFVLISWWGVNSDEDNATKVIFEVAKDIAPLYDIKLTISVEGCNESGVYNFTYLHNYIYDTYAEPYNRIWMHLNDKPLLTWMETGNMTGTVENRAAIHSDSRFENRIIGWSSFVDWFAWFPYSNSESRTPRLSDLDGFTSIIPRYDETRLAEYREVYADVDYTEGMYESQWKKVLEWIKQGKCHYVAIATWNDFTERSQIEPCFDATSFTPYPFYLADLTRHYIQLLNKNDSNVSGWWFVIVIAVLIIIILLGKLLFSLKPNLKIIQQS